MVGNVALVVGYVALVVGYVAHVVVGMTHVRMSHDLSWNGKYGQVCAGRHRHRHYIIGRYLFLKINVLMFSLRS